MPKLTRQQKKKIYFEKLQNLVETYPNIIIVSADNVGSRQMADIRMALRGRAILLFGKNTMIRTCLRMRLEANPKLQNLIDQINLNVGFVFCIDDPASVREKIMEFKVPASARQGAIAPVDVKIPSGSCGLDPSQTSFFQALGIPTKITKGQIELLSEVHLVHKDAKVAASQAALLQKLGIKPFEYGLKTLSVYDDGAVYDAAVLDITEADLVAKFSAGVLNCAAVSMAVSIPNEASLSFMLGKALKNCCALVVDGEYSFKQMDKVRAFLADPSAFAAAAPAAGGAAPAAAAAVEEDDEEEEDMGFDLFD